MPGPASRADLRVDSRRWQSVPSSMAWRQPANTKPRWDPPRVEFRAHSTPFARGAAANPLKQSSPIVTIRNLDYSVNGRPVFAGLDIQIPRGKITAVMGPSGTGKTTLLRLITGQVPADGGDIQVAGANMRAISRSNLYVLRRRMGMLFQNGALLTDLSVFENVAFPLREHTDLTERLIRQLVLTKLQAVGLRGAAELMPAELSGGMSRRVALARAIVMDPELL